MTAAFDLAMLPSVATLDRELVAREGFAEFVKLAWPLVENTPLKWSKHIALMCDYLERLYRGEIRELVINVPPGMGKSLICSVLFPAWIWTMEPGFRTIAASFSAKVSERDARSMRTLVEHPWFKARWPEVALPADTSASKSVREFRTTAKGMRYSTTVRGALLGFHGDLAICDDPISPKQAAMVSGVELDAVIEWWTGTLSTRFRDHATSRKLVVMQRIHERDLSAYMIARGATVLCLPMRYESTHPNVCVDDWRTDEGELLCPERFPPATVDALENEMKGQAAGQLQQRPAPKGGAVFLESYFENRWKRQPEGVYSISVDATFKQSADSDFVAMTVWCHKGSSFFLVDAVHQRMGFVATVKALLALCERYPQATAKYIEAAANGEAIMDTLRDEVSGLIAVRAKDKKEARANAVLPLFAAGNVILPDEIECLYDDGRTGAPWVGRYIAELLSFPRGAHDDLCDSSTMYLAQQRHSYVSRLEAFAQSRTPTP